MPHLDIDRWFCKRPDGSMRIRKVSEEAEQFPIQYRLVFRDNGLTVLCNVLMSERDLSLFDAWEEVKRMFNFHGEEDAPKRQHSETEKHL